MCSSGKPLLCFGKSNRHRCVPFTSLIHASPLESSAAAVRVPAIERPAAAAAPNIPARKLRRWVVDSEFTDTLLLNRRGRAASSLPLAVEHVLGLIGHERLLADICRLRAAGRRRHASNRVHALNERRLRHLVAAGRAE